MSAGGGYPNRPSRTSFGPKLKNPKPVTNPETQADAGAFNLDFWQISGAGLMVPRAWAVLDATSGTMTMPANAEAWNPNKTQAAPTPARSGVGLYTLAYAASYLDNNDSSIGLAIVAAMAFPLNSISRRIAPSTVAGTTITINLRSSPADALVDGAVMVFLW